MIESPSSRPPWSFTLPQCDQIAVRSSSSRAFREPCLVPMKASRPLASTRSAEPQKESARRYAIYCPFKDTPEDKESAPIRFVFDLTKSGWKFAGLDNINE